MEKIADKLFSFIYQMPENHDSFLEQTEIYKRIKVITIGLHHDSKFILENELFDCALKIIAVQFVQKENHGFANEESVKSDLEIGIESLKRSELCSLSDYFSLFKQLKPDEGNDELFFTDNEGEHIAHNTVSQLLLRALLNEIEKHLIRLKAFLSKQEKSIWYEMYGAEGEYEKETIDHIVKAVL
jgi:hypothetical protein